MEIVALLPECFKFKANLPYYRRNSVVLSVRVRRVHFKPFGGAGPHPTCENYWGGFLSRQNKKGHPTFIVKPVNS